MGFNRYCLIHQYEGAQVDTKLVGYCTFYHCCLFLRKKKNKLYQCHSPFVARVKLEKRRCVVKCFGFLVVYDSRWSHSLNVEIVIVLEFVTFKNSNTLSTHQRGSLKCCVHYTWSCCTSNKSYLPLPSPSNSWI
jgi:hypothetical protein